MPAKGRRVASRQAQLGRRRRRQDRSSDGLSVVGPAPVAVETDTSGSVSTQTEESVVPEREPAGDAAPRPDSTTQPRRSARTRIDRPAASNYIAPELRRISILSGVLFSVLIVLAFIL